MWSQAYWQTFHKQSASDVSEVMDESSARLLSARFGRKVLRSYSSSFYAVTRFLPPDKKAPLASTQWLLRKATEELGAGGGHSAYGPRNLGADPARARSRSWSWMRRTQAPADLQTSAQAPFSHEE